MSFCKAIEKIDMPEDMRKLYCMSFETATLLIAIYYCQLGNEPIVEYISLLRERYANEPNSLYYRVLKSPIDGMITIANKLLANRIADKYRGTLTDSEITNIIFEEWKKLNPRELISPIEDKIIVEKMKIIYNEWSKNEEKPYDIELFENAQTNPLSGILDQTLQSINKTYAPICENNNDMCESTKISLGILIPLLFIYICVVCFLLYKHEKNSFIARMIKNVINFFY